VTVSKEWIGMFDVAYDIEHLDERNMQEIINWLAVNCTGNFVVNEIRRRIVAGGFSDNKQAYKNGYFNIVGSDPRTSFIIEGPLAASYQVRLHKSDALMFRMRWINESVDMR